jgi:catechol 2,3-dioxygenase-like lactoylglutathione lyase family enzyme
MSGSKKLGTLFLLFGIVPAAFGIHATAVDSVAFSVSDLERSIDFYTQVLTFHKVSETEVAGPEYERLFGVFGVRIHIARLQLGNEFIELRQFLAPEGRPIPIDAHSNDQSFQHIAVIVSDMDKAYAILRAHHVRYASSGPQKLPDWNTKAGGIQAFYFKDPDGHPLEILAFPGGKGDPQWHAKQKGDPLFLGIDHTAIVVRSTQKSLDFYRDHLGLAVKGESENYGTEQEHLNNVSGAHLRITGLRGSSGPGIEFLEYLNGPQGRDYPADSGANDLWFTETIVKAADIQERSQIRDPDGHAILLEENADANEK